MLRTHDRLRTRNLLGNMEEPPPRYWEAKKKTRTEFVAGPVGPATILVLKLDSKFGRVRIT